MSPIVYTLPNCPRCDEIKEMLSAKGIAYGVLDLEDDFVQADLLLDGITITEAPVIYEQKDRTYRDYKQAREFYESHSA
jgi:arsenate reductase-like glutaredoxin family protein